MKTGRRQSYLGQESRRLAARYGFTYWVARRNYWLLTKPMDEDARRVLVNDIRQRTAKSKQEA